MFAILKTPLASYLASMTRFFLRSRRLFAVSIFLLLAVVVSLSSATRRPCLRVCSGPWRVCKAGRMTKAETQEICNQRVAAEAQTLVAAPEVTLPPHPSSAVRLDEDVPPAIPIVAQTRRFRAPPSLV
jgi:hypothetical protein